MIPMLASGAGLFARHLPASPGSWGMGTIAGAIIGGVMIGALVYLCWRVFR